MNKPKVKLLSLWMADEDYPGFYNSFICKGIWEARAVNIEEGRRVYDFVCVMPMSQQVKLGDKRKMPEETILKLCHQVEIKHLPKVKFEE